MELMSNLKLLAKGLVLAAVVLVLVGLCGKFLGAWGFFVGLGLGAVACAFLIDKFGAKAVEEANQDGNG